VLIDSGMNIKGKFYRGAPVSSSHPAGIHHRVWETSLMRWSLGDLAKAVSFPTCLSLEELVEYNCFPFARFAAIDDAAQIEKAPGKLKDLGNEETDPRLKSLYYRQSRTLFDRLAYGNAKSIRKDRILFFYDWYNWMDAKLGTGIYRTNSSGSSRRQDLRRSGPIHPIGHTAIIILCRLQPYDAGEFIR